MPAGTEDFDGLTVISKTNCSLARDALVRGVPVYSSLTNIAIMGALCNE